MSSVSLYHLHALCKYLKLTAEYVASLTLHRWVLAVGTLGMISDSGVCSALNFGKSLSAGNCGGGVLGRLGIQGDIPQPAGVSPDCLHAHSLQLD
jgi:hypothetical protein